MKISNAETAEELENREGEIDRYDKESCNDLQEATKASDSTEDALKKVAGSADQVIDSKILTSDQKILTVLRESLLPFSDKLDPFAALPVHLDRFQEHLVQFYLLYYPQVTYGFSPRLRPHPIETNFSIALTTPACFQVALARSALYRLSLSKYTGDREKKALEVAMMRHKGEALRHIRLLNAKASHSRKDDLLASIISIGTLDRRTGAKSTAGMHYLAVRRILKTTGGPLAVRSLLLSRVMVFFECIYGTSPESYIWDESDLGELIQEFNSFLSRLWNFWKSLFAILHLRTESSETQRLRSFHLQPGSSLLAIVSRQPGPADPFPEQVLPQHRLELICQLTCLITLAAIILDCANEFAPMQTYMDSLHNMVEDLKLAGQSSNNVMWQIQINDHSDKHSKRIWKSAGYAWVMKHTSWNVQNQLKRWLLDFLTGEGVEGRKAWKLNPFHFSYAS